MKVKLFITLLLFSVVFVTKAQIRAQGTLGFATATGDLADGANGGLGVGLNARYIFSDRLDAGLSYDSNILAAEGEGVFGVTGITAKGFFKLTNTKVHPYIAFAVGVYTNETPEITVTVDDGSGPVTTTIPSESSSGLGFSPEFGLNFGGFGIGVQYTDAGDLPESTTKATFLKYFIGYTISFGDL